MSPGALGAFLLVLVGIFVLGNLWFHLVETLLNWVKRCLIGDRETGAWHPLPTDTEDQEDADHKTTK